MMAKIPKEQLEKGVICSSAGNHAQGVALSAQKLGCNAVIAMPVTTPEIKVGLVCISNILLCFTYLTPCMVISSCYVCYTMILQYHRIFFFLLQHF